jgi:hypothetical protein
MKFSGCQTFPEGKRSMEGGYEKPNRPIFADTHIPVVLYQKKENKNIQVKKYPHAFFPMEKIFHVKKT